jgi:hypothetical protein
LKRSDNSSSMEEGRGPGAKGGSLRRKEGGAGCFPLPRTISRHSRIYINTITSNKVCFDSYNT